MKSSTRDRLVEAARILFWKHGYSSTGIAQILKEADAGSGSLYYFFPTKEDLLLAVLEWYRENLWSAVVQPVFDRVSDPIERIFGILDAYRRGLLMTNYQHGCPIGNLALELADSHPAARNSWPSISLAGARQLNNVSPRALRSCPRHSITSNSLCSCLRRWKELSCWPAPIRTSSRTMQPSLSSATISTVSIRMGPTGRPWPQPTPQAKPKSKTRRQSRPSSSG